MTLDDIVRLALAAERAGLESLELSQANGVLRLRFAAARPPAPAGPVVAVAAPKRPKGVPAPGVGRFLHCHPSTGQPVTTPGQRVEAGQIVGLLEIGPGLRPVPAPRDGIIGMAVVADRALVGYGTILYEMD